MVEDICANRMCQGCSNRLPGDRCANTPSSCRRYMHTQRITYRYCNPVASFLFSSTMLQSESSIGTFDACHGTSPLPTSSLVGFESVIRKKGYGCKSEERLLSCPYIECYHCIFFVIQTFPFTQDSDLPRPRWPTTS